MRFIVFVMSNPSIEAGGMPSKQDLLDMQAFNQKLVDARVMLSGEGLHPSKEGTRMAFSKGKAKVTDGPYAEAKEVVAGYWILEARSKDEVIDWMKQAPFQDADLENPPDHRGRRVRVRPRGHGAREEAPRPDRRPAPLVSVTRGGAVEAVMAGRSHASESA